MTLRPRQILFFLAAVAPVGKLVLLPAQLAGIAGNDLWMPALAQLLFQAALIFCVLLLARRERTVLSLIRAYAGGGCAASFAVLYALFLLFCAFLPIVEQKVMVRSIFYDTIPAHLVFAPFFLFSAYLACRPLPALGRVWDILTPVSVVCIIGLFLLSVGSCDFGALAPAGAAGKAGFFAGTAAAFSRFSDAAFLLPLVGRFRYERGFAAKGALCYLAGGGVLLLFLAVFYGVFGEIAPLQSLAFARVGAFFPARGVVGRVDYLFAFGLAFVMAFYAVLPVHGAVGLVCEAFGERKLLAPLLSAGVNAALFAAVYLLNFYTVTVVSLFSGALFWVFPLFGALLPLLLALLLGRRRDRGGRRAE